MRQLFILIMLASMVIVNAQKVLVNDSEERIDGILCKGMETVIQLESNMIEKGWNKFLKEYGKVDSRKGNIYFMEAAEIRDVSSTPVKIYSRISVSNIGIRVFWAIELGSEFVTSGNKKLSAEKLLHDFGVKMYIQHINDQIEDAEKALQTTVKNQERKIKEGTNLEKKIENNKEDKINLENKLKENASDLINLLNSQKQNVLDQKAAAEDVEKMKKAVESVKSKLSKVE